MTGVESRTIKRYKITDKLDTGMSYAVLANEDRLRKHRHAWKVWKTLRDFGCKVYVVAPELNTFEGSKIYSELSSLKGKVDVVVPCLREEYLKDLVADSAAVEAKYIWFQEKNWTPEFSAQCEERGIEVVRGCVLKHKVYYKPLAWFNPCYWHGWKERKVESRYKRV